MSLSKQAKEGIREEFLEKFNRGNFGWKNYADKRRNPILSDENQVVDFFIRRFEEEGEEKIARIKDKLKEYGDSLSAKSLRENPLSYHAKQAVKNKMHSFHEVLQILNE